MGEYAEEGKVKELVRRCGEVADGLEREEEEEREEERKRGEKREVGVVGGKRKRVSRP